MTKGNKNKQGGFSLIESMIATLVIGVSFAGVYSLTAFSVKNLYNSADKQRMQLVADQILEVIDSDRENVDNYALDFTSCDAPTSGETEDYHQFRYKWCRMLNDHIGPPATGDQRDITISAVTDGKLVSIVLQSQNATSEVNVKRLINE